VVPAVAGLMTALIGRGLRVLAQGDYAELLPGRWRDRPGLGRAVAGPRQLRGTVSSPAVDRSMRRDASLAGLA
jgi:hypothetical protein